MRRNDEETMMKPQSPGFASSELVIVCREAVKHFVESVHAERTHLDSDRFLP